MKRLLLTLTLALSLIGFSSFTNHDGVAPAALKSFQTSFGAATDVSWSFTSNLFKAYFSLNGQYVTAYYDGEGKMVALTRNISSLQLPIRLQASLKRNFGDYWISDLFEMANDEGTNYYVTLENADTKIILKSADNEDWYRFKKLRKA